MGSLSPHRYVKDVLLLIDDDGASDYQIEVERFVIGFDSFDQKTLIIFIH